MGTEIRINYADVMNKAKQMHNQSLELYYQICRLENAEKDLSREWNSPASQVFRTKLVHLAERIKATRRKMYDTSEIIENTAKAIYRADLEACENAKHL